MRAGRSAARRRRARPRSDRAALRRGRRRADPLQPPQPDRRRSEPGAAGRDRRRGRAPRRLGARRRDPRAADPSRRPARAVPHRLRGGGGARHRLLLGLEDVQRRRPALRPDHHRLREGGRGDRGLPFSATHCGHLGAIASVAAFRDGGPWLDDVLAVLDHNRGLLAELLAEHLPEVGYAQPRAGYLAWLDLRALDLGEDPSAGDPRARPGRAQPGAELRPPGRRLRAAELRHLTGAARAGGRGNRQSGRPWLTSPRAEP